MIYGFMDDGDSVLDLWTIEILSWFIDMWIYERWRFRPGLLICGFMDEVDSVLIYDVMMDPTLLRLGTPRVV